MARNNLPGDTRPMYWVCYKELYVERLETRYPESDHPKNVRAVLDRFQRVCGLRTRRLHQLSNVDLDTYVKSRRRDKWRGKPLANRTLNNEIDILNAALALAGPPETRGAGRKNLGLIMRPPFAERLPEQKTIPVAVAPIDLQRFFAAVEFASSPIIKGCTPAQFWVAAVVLDLVTGLRRKGLIRIPRPDDYELLELKQIVLPARLSKTRTEQRISLGSQEIVDLLAALPTKPGQPLLPWTNRRTGDVMSLSHFNRQMVLIQERAGIPRASRIRLKDLRSTAATETIEEFGPGIARRKLGHAPTTNTIHTNYDVPRVSKQDQAASAHLAGIVMPLVQPPAPPPGLRIFDEGASA